MYEPKIYKDRGGDRQVFLPGSILDVRGQIIPPDTFMRFYYVDGTNGVDTYDGLSAQRPFATIQAAMDAITARGALRGRSAVFVAPGGYAENIITPLNTIAPFGALIATTPTKRAGGATYLSPATATSPVLTVRARGWRINGFEIDAGASGGCVHLDGTTSDANPKYVEIDDCLLIGAAGAYGILSDHSTDLARVHHNFFLSIALEAISCVTAQQLFWEIFENDFEDCQKAFAPRSSLGPNGMRMHHNRFQHTGNTYGACTPKIDTRGGSQNLVGPENFLPSTYDEAGGYYSVGSDWWYGNYSEDLGGVARPIA